MMPCFPSSILSPSSTAIKSVCSKYSGAVSCPGQHAFCPSPCQSLDEQEDKGQHRKACAQAKASERHGKGQQKDGLHIEDQKNDGVEIVCRSKLHPGIALRFQAALVDGVLDRIRFGRRKHPGPQPCERQRRKPKSEGGDEENSQ